MGDDSGTGRPQARVATALVFGGFMFGFMVANSMWMRRVSWESNEDALAARSARARDDEE